LRQRVETAKQILALPDPTKRIPELKVTLQPVQDRVREVLRSRIDTVQQQSLQMREQVQTYVTQAYVSQASGDLGDRLNAIALSSATADLDRVVAIANESKNIDAAIARETDLKSLYNSLISRIDEQAIAIQKEMQQEAQKQSQTSDTSDQPPVEIPVIKPITAIRATDLVTKPILETEEEVKEYVTALGRAMIKEIRQGKRIRLE